MRSPRVPMLPLMTFSPSMPIQRSPSPVISSRGAQAPATVIVGTSVPAHPAVAASPPRQKAPAELTVLRALLLARYGSLPDAFRAMDPQGTGTLTVDSFSAVVQRLGYADNAIEVFGALDTSGTGYVSMAGFLDHFDGKSGFVTKGGAALSSPKVADVASPNRRHTMGSPSRSVSSPQPTRGRCSVGAVSVLAGAEGLPTEAQQQLSQVVSRLSELEKQQKRAAEQNVQMVRELVASTFAEQADSLQSCRSEAADLRAELKAVTEKLAGQEAWATEFQQRFETYSHLVEEYLGDIKGLVFKPGEDGVVPSAPSPTLRGELENLQKMVDQTATILGQQSEKLSGLEHKMRQESAVSPAFSFKDGVVSKAQPGAAGAEERGGGGSELSTPWQRCELKLQAAALDEFRRELTVEREERVAEQSKIMNAIQDAMKRCLSDTIDATKPVGGQSAEERLQVRLDLALAGARDDIGALGTGLDACRKDIEKEREEREEKLRSMVAYFETSLRKVADSAAQVEELVDERSRATDLRVSSMQCEIQGQSCSVEELKQEMQSQQKEMQADQKQLAAGHKSLAADFMALMERMDQHNKQGTPCIGFTPGSEVDKSVAKNDVSFSFAHSSKAIDNLRERMDRMRELPTMRELPSGVASASACLRLSPEVERMMRNSRASSASCHSAASARAGGAMSVGAASSARLRELTPPPQQQQQDAANGAAGAFYQSTATLPSPASLMSGAPQSARSVQQTTLMSNVAASFAPLGMSPVLASHGLQPQRSLGGSVRRATSADIGPSYR